MMNRISVIVPVYNIKDHIGRCIDSILDQTHTDLEIIIVDDGSDDGSDAVIDELAKRDDRMRVIHTEHRGALQARLAGTKAATGDWIGFVDGDDTIEPEMYERLLDNALVHNADISHCGYKMIYDGDIVMEHSGTGSADAWTGTEYMNRLINCEHIELLSISNKLFRRELFTERFYREVSDLDVSLNEDLLVNYMLAIAADNVVSEDVCLYNYIQREGSSTRTVTPDMLLDSIRVREVIKRCSDGELREKAAKEYLDVCIKCYNHLIRTRVEDEQGYDEYGCAEKIRRMIENEKDAFIILDKDMRIIADLIVKAPKIHEQMIRNACRTK